VLRCTIRIVGCKIVIYSPTPSDRAQLHMFRRNVGCIQPMAGTEYRLTGWRFEVGGTGVLVPPHWGPKDSRPAPSFVRIMRTAQGPLHFITKLTSGPNNYSELGKYTGRPSTAPSTHHAIVSTMKVLYQGPAMLSSIFRVHSQPCARFS